MLREPNRYELRIMKEIIEADAHLNKLFLDYGETLDSDELSFTLVSYKHIIQQYTLDELTITKIYTVEKIKELKEELNYPNELYRYIIYLAKYGVIKTFFVENYKKFLPVYDFASIYSDDKKRLFVEAFFKEFDRFSYIIELMSKLKNIDEAPEEYLNYLAYIVGYQKEADDVFINISFRELIKNIVEIYKIKGSNYSFELFFGLLGFIIDLREYWFDRRFYDPNILANSETMTYNKKLSKFYLTTIKPSDRVFSQSQRKLIVSEGNITETKDLFEFERKLRNEKATLRQLLGFDPTYKGETYTYFKTNVIEYSLSSDRYDDIDTSKLGIELVEKYAEFLTPIFIRKNINIMLKPIETDGESIILSDDDRIDPRSPEENAEGFFHTYSGYQPIHYYWEDGLHNYVHINKLKSGRSGFYIGGFHLDTTSNLSGYESASGANHTEKIENLGMGDRDVYYPLYDTHITGGTEFVHQPLGTSFVYYGNNFSYIKGDQKRLSEVTGEHEEKTKISYIPTNYKVAIDYHGELNEITPGEKIEIIFSKYHENNGVYTVESVSPPDPLDEDSAVVKRFDNLDGMSSIPNGPVPFSLYSEYGIETNINPENKYRALTTENKWHFYDHGVIYSNITNVDVNHAQAYTQAYGVALFEKYESQDYYGREYSNLFSNPSSPANQTVTFTEEGEYWVTCATGTIKCEQGTATPSTPLLIFISFQLAETEKDIYFELSCTEPMLSKNFIMPYTSSTVSANHEDITMDAPYAYIKFEDNAPSEVIFDWNYAQIGYEDFVLGEFLDEYPKPLFTFWQDSDNYISVSVNSHKRDKVFVNGVLDGSSFSEYEFEIDHELLPQEAELFMDVFSLDNIKIKIDNIPTILIDDLTGTFEPTVLKLGYDAETQYFQGQLGKTEYGFSLHKIDEDPSYGSYFARDLDMSFSQLRTEFMSDGPLTSVDYFNVTGIRTTSTGTYNLQYDLGYIKVMRMIGAQRILYEKVPMSALEEIKKISIKAKRISSTGNLKLGIIGYKNDDIHPTNINDLPLYENYMYLPISEYPENEYKIYDGYLEKTSGEFSQQISTDYYNPSGLPDHYDYFNLIIEIDGGEFYLDYISFMDITGDAVYITVTELIPTTHSEEGGFIQLYYEDWKMGDSKFKDFHDRVVEVDKVVHI